MAAILTEAGTVILGQDGSTDIDLETFATLPAVSPPSAPPGVLMARFP